MNTISNPYIGPRTFTEDERDRFYGREREADELLARVLSEQEVVFYAQSGAGKSSLVNTCLIPQLREDGIEVLLGRVGGDAPAGLEVDNIFVFNLLRSLSTSEVNADTLSKRSLSEFLVLNPDGRGSKRRALIIDQFEEIFSTHDEAWEKRADFFKQLAKALKADPRLRVVFVMREDFIASMDPYARLLPGRFQVRYYMQRLEYGAALKAVKEPVKSGDFSRPYEAGVAEKLVDDLRSVKVYKSDGTEALEPGQYVEPVQLQVVCYNLWEHLPDGGTRIREQDLQDVGNVSASFVSASLGKYYETRVKAVAEAKQVNERKIREWFTDKLISPTGIRNMVLQERGGKSGGLENDVIQALPDLVRAETRGGATFYELTHDRLVEPIIENNKQWDLINSSPFRSLAEEWVKSAEDKKQDHLLSDHALLAASQWATEHPNELTEAEKEFLEECHAKQMEREARRERQAQQEKLESTQRRLELAEKLKDEQARSAQRARRFNLIAGALVILALIATGFAITNLVRVNRTSEDLAFAIATAKAAEADAIVDADAALSGQLSAYALDKSSSQPDLAILLGLVADRLHSNINSRSALLSLQQENAGVKSFLSLETPPDEFQFSPDSKIVASRDKDGVTLWDADTLEKLNEPFNGHFSGVTAWVLSQDGTLMVSGGADGTIVIWDAIKHEKISGPFKSHKGSISSLALNKEGTTLTAASWDEDGIVLWDITNPSQPQVSDEPLLGHSGGIASLAFSPDGKTLASGGNSDSIIILWNVEAQQAIGEPLTGHEGTVISMAFTPNGNILASGSYDYTNILWNVSDLEKPKQIEKLADEIYIDVVAISPDGNTLASGNDNGDIVLWDISTQEKTSTLFSDTSWVISLAFSPDGETLVSGSLDGKVILWDVSEQAQIGETLSVSVHEKPVRGVAFQPESKTLITASEDSYLAFWNIENIESPKPDDSLQGHTGFPTGIRFSADGSLLASLGDEGTIFFDVASQEQLGYGDFIPTRANEDIVAYQITKQGGITVHVKEIASGDLTTIPITGTNPILSPNGRILAYQTYGTESSPSQLHLWDVTANKELPAPISGENPAFSPDGEVLIYTTQDPESGESLINLWDIANAKSIGEPILGDFGIISPDNTILTYTTSDPETGEFLINQWNIREARLLGTSIRANNFEISENGEILAFEYVDESTEVSAIKTLNMVTGELSENLVEDGGIIGLSSDGQFLLYRVHDDSGDLSANVVDTRSSETVISGPIKGDVVVDDVSGRPRLFQAGQVLAFEIINDNKTQLALIDTSIKSLLGNVIENGSYLGQTNDGKIMVYESGNEIHLLDTEKKSTLGPGIKGTFMGISSDGKTLAFHSGSGLITFWDLSKSWPLGEPVTNALEEISEAVLSQDGSTLAWIGPGGVVLQNVMSDKLSGGPYSDHETNVVSGSTQPAFSMDGKLLAIGNFNTHTTSLWDLESGAQLEELPGSYPAFSPDGGLLAVGNFNTETTTFWDVNSRQQVGDEVHEYFAIPTFSVDGKLLAIGNFDTSTTTLWDVNTRQQVGDELPGSYPAFSPDGKLLAVSNSNTQTTTIWDVNTRQQVGDELLGDWAAFSADGKLLAIGNYSTQTTTLWDVNTRQQVEDELPGSYPAFSPDGKLLAVGNYNTQTTTIWDMDTRQQVGDELLGDWAAFSADGKLLAIGSEETLTTSVWEVTAEKTFTQSYKGFQTLPENLTLSSTRKYLASLAANDIVIRNLDADMSLHLELVENMGQLNGPISFYANDTHFAAVGDDGTLLTWKTATGELATPEETDQPPQLKSAFASVFSPAGDYLAYAYNETNLIVWDVKNGKRYAKLKDPEIEKPVGAISFSADGKWMAYSDGPKIVLWDLQSKKSVGAEPLLTEAISINQLNLIMDDDKIAYVVSTDESNATQIWDWNSRTKIGNPMQDLRIVGLNQQDRLVYYLDPAGRLIQWQWGSDLTTLLCPLVKRNFTLAEWKTYFGERPYPAQSDLTCPDYPSGQEVAGN